MPSNPRGRWISAALITLLVVAIVVGVTAWRTGQRLRSDLGATASELTRLEDLLRDELQWAELPSRSGARLARFTPTDDGVEGLRGYAVYDSASGRAIIVIDGVGDQTDDELELWAEGSDGSVSLGVIPPEGGSRVRFRVPDLDRVPGLRAFTVSREPRDDSVAYDVPRGDVVMIAELSTMEPGP